MLSFALTTPTKSDLFSTVPYFQITKWKTNNYSELDLSPWTAHSLINSYSCKKAVGHIKDLRTAVLVAGCNLGTKHQQQQFLLARLSLRDFTR